MDIVSYETAMLLKKHGFKRPVDFGQFWYIDYTGEVEIITLISLKNGPHIHRMFIPWTRGMNSADLDVFIAASTIAPGTIDLFSELDGWELTFDKNTDQWTCCLPSYWCDTRDGDFYTFVHASAAEACAQAWILKHPI